MNLKWSCIIVTFYFVYQIEYAQSLQNTENSLSATSLDLLISSKVDKNSAKRRSNKRFNKKQKNLQGSTLDSDFSNDGLTFSNKTSEIRESHPGKKKSKMEKRKRKIGRIASKPGILLNKNKTLPSVSSKLGKNEKLKNRKRLGKKNKKRIAKEKGHSNILELTTARNYSDYHGNLTNFSQMIEKLNKNPEFNFESHHQRNSTKSKRMRKKKRCEKNNGGCSQKCSTKGKKKCACFEGYVLAKNRKLCIDVDECKYANGGCEQTCENILGGHICSCQIGLRIADDRRSCQDVNECLLRNGHGPCQSSCKNTHGSYVCGCPNGTKLGPDLHACEDVDECALGTSGCSHGCINAYGRSYCSCPKGMQLAPDWKTCEDIDECADDEIKVTCKYGCVNTIGSFHCEEADFQNDHLAEDGKSVVCASLEPPKNGFITCDRNDRSSFDTFSKTGRRTIRNRPGTKCKLQCRDGFKLIGDDDILCGLNGTWIGGKKSFCQGKSSDQPKEEKHVLKSL